MEKPPLIDVRDLARDWISGISGEAFGDLVARKVSLLKADKSVEERGALLAETDPVCFAAAFFAGVSLGIPIILANPQWRLDEWKQLSDLINPSVIMGSAPLETILRKDIRHPRPGEILIPTGGTTGGVKLAIHDWASLGSACRGLLQFLGNRPIHSACCLPLFHVSGLMQLVRSFLSGGSIRFDRNEINGYCLSLVPTQLQRLLADEEMIEKLRQARVVFVGGAAMPEELAEKVRQLRLPVMPVYGMTETAAMLAVVPVENFIHEKEPGALPLGDTRILIEADGCIRIRSSALFKGYHGRAPVDLSRGYRSGDAGRLDALGRLRVLGRMDRLIVTGGEKVDPAEVQQKLLKLEGIEQALVRGEPDAEWGEAVVAYLQTDGRPLSSAALRKQLSRFLVSYKLPRKFYQVDSFSPDLNDVASYVRIES